MIKVIFFDAAGTLFHLPRGVGWHYQAVAAQFGCQFDARVLDNAFAAVWREMPPRMTTGQPRLNDDKDWWRDLVERVLNRCEAERTKLDRKASFEELYGRFTQPAVWELYPEVVEVLTALRERYQLAVISNFDRRLRPILATLGLAEMFRPLVISSETGADKPHALIFTRALSLAGVRAAEALHVGDDPVRDWQGAEAAGLHAFHLARPATSLRDLLPHLTALSAS